VDNQDMNILTTLTYFKKYFFIVFWNTKQNWNHYRRSFWNEQ